MTEPESRATCIICGLPLTRNPHPQAGTIAWLSQIGAMYGCLPCAEKRSSGRYRVITRLRIWLHDQLMYEGDEVKTVRVADVLQKLEQLEAEHRAEYHNAKAGRPDAD